MSSTRLPTKPLVVLENDDDDLIPEDPATAPLPYIYDILPPLESPLKTHPMIWEHGTKYYRLFTLFPGAHSTPLQGELRTLAIEGGHPLPVHEALSYTWNDSTYENLVIRGTRVADPDYIRSKYTIRHPLWLDGKRLLISTNLRDALRHIRGREENDYKTLWIDAVCINQQDVRERGSQVVLMPKIYHDAKMVHFWLGEEDDESLVAIGLLKKLHEEFDNSGSDFAYMESQISNKEEFERLGLPGLDSEQWHTIQTLFKRPVFERMWIVQELCLARDIIVRCGSLCFGLFDLFAGVEYLHHSGWTELISKFTKRTWGNCEANYRSIGPLLRQMVFQDGDLGRQLISTTRGFKTSDPRDKIFAMLGLLNNHAHRYTHDLYHGGDFLADTWRADGWTAVRSEDGHLQLHKTFAQEGEEGETFSQWQESLQSRMRASIDEESRDEEKFTSKEEDLSRKMIQLELGQDPKASSAAEIPPRCSRSSHNDTDVAQSASDISVDAKFAPEVAGMDVHESKPSTDSTTLSFVSSTTPVPRRESTTETDQETVLDDHEDYSDVIEVATRRLRDGGTSARILHRHLTDYLWVSLNTILGIVLLQAGEALDGDPGVHYAVPELVQQFKLQNLDIHLGEETMPLLRQLWSSNETLQGMEAEAAINDLVSLLTVGDDEELQAAPRITHKPTPIFLIRFFDSRGEMYYDTLKQAKKICLRVHKVLSCLQDADLEGGRDSTANCLPMGLPPPNIDSISEEKITLLFEAAIEKQRRVTHFPKSKWKQWSSQKRQLTLPDYTLTVKEVFREFTLGYIQQSNSLWLLSTIEDCKESGRLGLPSWVPDYTVNVWKDHTSLYNTGRYYASGQGAIPFISADANDGNVLVLKAANFKRIINIESGLVKAAAPQGDRILECINMSTSHSGHHQQHYERPLEALARTMIGNNNIASTKEEQAHPASPSSVERFYASRYCLQFEQYWRRSDVLCWDSLLTGLLADTKTERDVNKYLEGDKLRCSFINQVEAELYGKVFCITACGYYAMVPKLTEVGDLICIIQGSEVPFVLRRLENGQYTLVGECYVHEWMYGEGLVGAEFEEIQLV